MIRVTAFLAAVAWRNLWRHRRRSLITASAMAIALGLCMSMIALTDGMMGEFSRVLIDQKLGHVQVHHADYLESRAMYDSLEGAEALLARIDELASTHAATARLYGYALVGGAEKSAGARLVGIDPNREQTVTNLRMVEGEGFSGEPGEILLGRGLAETLEMPVGAEVVVVTQAADGSMGNEIYRVRGIYQTGDAVQDRGGAYLLLPELQSLLVLPDQVHEITVLSKDKETVAAFASEISGVAPEGLDIRPWWEISPQTSEMMGMQDFSIGIILVIVFSVAAFGILNTMLMSVFERTRELGVLKAIGLRPRRMVALIVLESLMLAALSCAIGLVIGGSLDAWLVLEGINMGADMEDMSFQGAMLDPQIYGMVRAGPVITAVCAVFIVAVLASLWPAMRAARLDPVASIRAE